MPLLRSYELIYDLQPPVETGGYKYFAPTERDAEGLMSGTERPRFPDLFGRLRASLAMGRSTFKRAAVEDMGAEQGNYYDVQSSPRPERNIYSPGLYVY
jgi:hypothetical protein